jgi:excisionase family DNA binding protein
MSDACYLPDQIERLGRAVNARELSNLLGVSPITLYKLAKAGRIPSFRIGSAVRFCPKAVVELHSGRSHSVGRFRAIWFVHLAAN